MAPALVTTHTRRRIRSTTAEPHGGLRRVSSRVHTKSNIFGIFDDENARESDVHETTDVYSAPKSGPLPLQTYSVQSGWVRAFDGRLVYIAHGRIEEVNDDNDNDNDNNKNNTTTQDMTTPRPLPSLSSLTDSAGRRNTFGIPITEPLPPSTTPPPCPRPDRVLQLLSSNSSNMAGPGYTTTLPLTITSTVQASVLDTPTEIALLQENLELISMVLEELRFMQTWFYAQTPLEPFTEHIETCTLIDNSVQYVRESLVGRKKLGEEEFNVRSQRWYEKYWSRLYSLRRTLERLLAVRPTIERRRLKPPQITLVLEKLKQHQSKMADLAHKFAASFDRLRLRHIHYLLTQAHSEAHRKRETRRLDENSFERQWYDDKSIRAHLRKEFLAHAQRTTHNRKTSAQ
ncbi:hypothetical protein FA15DRAFT_693625 [Coprinopsis marcescibilis]|uniref:Uncharacterized protein n=1 Tax=Coprinopsis marcescibilis TaxID=230819 RepID=A0A5C3KZ75_COPMA|nr:hypothetical protein FA15DRAFT_693625 [Coprinopsis marcescibilis]